MSWYVCINTLVKSVIGDWYISNRLEGLTNNYKIRKGLSLIIPIYMERALDGGERDGDEQRRHRRRPWRSESGGKREGDGGGSDLPGSAVHLQSPPSHAKLVSRSGARS